MFYLFIVQEYYYLYMKYLLLIIVIGESNIEDISDSWKHIKYNYIYRFPSRAGQILSVVISCFYYCLVFKVLS